jgi:hypothetical protein
MTARDVNVLAAGQPRDGSVGPIPAPPEQAIARLEAALQRVLAPLACVHTAYTEDACARAATAESAKAQAGLMLFMTEGLIRASVRQREKGISDVVSAVHEAWLRWLQLGGRKARVEVPMDGWLVEAYPSEWLQPASGFADALAITSSIGRPPPLLGDAELPLPFFEPLSHCHLGWAENGTRRDLSALLGVGAIVEGQQEVGAVQVELRYIAHTLLRDLYLTMQGLPVGGWARYPGY